MHLSTRASARVATRKNPPPPSTTSPSITSKYQSVEWVSWRPHSRILHSWLRRSSMRHIYSIVTGAYSARRWWEKSSSQREVAVEATRKVMRRWSQRRKKTKWMGYSKTMIESSCFLFTTQMLAYCKSPVDYEKTFTRRKIWIIDSILRQRI